MTDDTVKVTMTEVDGIYNPKSKTVEVDRADLIMICDYFAPHINLAGTDAFWKQLSEASGRLRAKLDK